MTSVHRELLSAPFAASDISWRRGAYGRDLAYLSTPSVIRRLNEATNNTWDFRLTRMEWHGTILIAIGELTLPGLGTRTGIGVQRVDDEALRTREDIIKGVASDALKKAATLFGVGLDLADQDVPPARHEGAESAPMGSTSDGDGLRELASLRQLNYIRALARQHGIVVRDQNGQWIVNDELVDEFLTAHCGIQGFPQLSRQQASEAIDFLVSLPKAEASLLQNGSTTKDTGTGNPAPPDEFQQLANVSWSEVWKELRALGINTVDEATSRLGKWSNDPTEIRQLINAVKERG